MNKQEIIVIIAGDNPVADIRDLRPSRAPSPGLELLGCHLSSEMRRGRRYRNAAPPKGVGKKY
jgi:hypothetical protein